MGPLQAERLGVIRMEATRLATSIYPSLATWPLANILQRLHESTCPLGASWSRHLHAVPPTLSLLSLASVSFGEWPNSDKTKSPSSFLMFFPSHLYFHFLDHSSDVPSQIFLLWSVLKTSSGTSEVLRGKIRFSILYILSLLLSSSTLLGFSKEHIAGKTGGVSEKDRWAELNFRSRR